MTNYAGYNATTFIINGLSNWNTSNVTNMNYMFQYAGYHASYYLYLSRWNVSNVSSHMYFNTGVTSKVTPPTWVK